MKATKGGVLMYIKNGINFIPRNDLEIERDKKLKSCFVEILNKKLPKFNSRSCL